MGIRLAICAAACVAAVSFSHSTALGQIRQSTYQPPATKPAHDPADVPVKQVVLFSSGVGYFEHGGTVHGDVATELRFKTDQVNDILKSLLLQDMDGGTIGTVSYPGLAPLAHTLKSFQVDITGNPDMADLLNQLRGAKLTVTTDTNHPITGIILGVEKKLRPAGDRSTVEQVKLNLKVGRQFQSVQLEEVHTLELDDPALQRELDDALAALAKARDQDKKTITLHFNGKGARQVKIGYLVETPIWKTSYRLVLEGDAAGKPDAGAARPSTQPTTRLLGLGDGQPHAAKLQGWAIVENQTDNDWNDVSLALVSGRPLSFIQDLYHAQYIPRPVVQPDNHVNLRPQTYAAGIFDVKDLTANVPDFTDAPDTSLNSGGQKGQGGGGGGAGLFSGGEGGMEKHAKQQSAQQELDPTASVISAATAARVGELFKYRVGNVSLARQTSAMIPIVTDDIDAERVSIYNASVLPNNPLLGARVRNNTKKYLLQGPVTVLDRGSYAGDARIEDLPPGQERLLSFGIDQQVLIDANDLRQKSEMVSAMIVKGVMAITSKNISEHTYLIDNKSDDTRTLVLEHPRQTGFKLVSPAQAEEMTPELLRFRRSIAPHKTVKMTIVQENISAISTELAKLESNTLILYSRDGDLPPSVRNALLKAIQLRNELQGFETRLGELRNQKTELVADQGRVRDNLKAVAGESDYHKRLMKKIDEEESELEKIQKAFIETEQKRQAAEKQLADYLEGLTVQ